MGRSLLHNLLILICLIAVQVLICNHIMLFNAATAFIFIYIIIALPADLATGWVLTWAFLSGLSIDIFSDTLGLNAMACTISGVIRRPVLFAYIPKDDRTKSILPSLRSMGFLSYSKYLLTMTSVYCLTIFIIEYFSFADIREILIYTCASSLFTYILLLAIDSLAANKRNAFQ